MDEDTKLLIEQFRQITNKGWIKSISNSFGSIGLTFEKELGKKPDAMYFPDYHGIEIKCTSRYSKYPLYLFTIAFDGPTFPEINRIVESYGWPDKDYSDKKVLFAKLSFKEKKTVNGKYKFQLSIDKNEEKILLNVYDLNNKLIDNQSFVYIDSIYNHFTLKLKKLALIYASIKREEKEKYFKYYKINIYQAMDFNNFLAKLENDTIGIDLISRMNKSGLDAGKYRNKNLVFYIKKDRLNEIFTKIY